MKNAIKNIYSFLSYYVPFLPKFIEQIYYWINNITTNENQYKYNITQGKKILNNIINDSKYYYVMIDKGIGDTVLVSSYAYVLKKKYKKEIAFIVPKGHIDVVKRFEYVKKIIGLSKNELEKIALYISSSNLYETEFYCYAYFKMKISRNGKRNWSSAEWDKKLFLSDRYKKYVFNVNQELNPYKIKTTKCKKELLKRYNIKNKSIIIMPYANTVVNLKTIFWENLVNCLNNLGYNVYTNIGNPKLEKAVKGTTPLNISLSDIFDISYEINCFIALRSGICEYLALNNSKMIVINKNEMNYDRWDDVNLLSSKKTIKNVYVNKKKESELISEIRDLLKER